MFPDAPGLNGTPLARTAAQRRGQRSSRWPCCARSTTIGCTKAASPVSDHPTGNLHSDDPMAPTSPFPNAGLVLVLTFTETNGDAD